jgi:16S rRNA (adenine1518-N6/adenine1519-N6)-dimethyltransferase
VTAVELDKSLPPLLKESLAEYDNVEIVSGDILKTDIASLLNEKMPGMRYAVCANLPYNITTPVLTALIETGMFESITVMIQREVARRICASAGDEDYGAFSVYAQYHTLPKMLFDVPPSCFMPQPKVYSSVIKMSVRDKKAVEVHNEELFFRTVRASFAQRRKTLVNGLSSGFSGQLTKPQVVQALQECGFDEKIRGEKLTIEQFGIISDKLGQMLE